jgi:hypothetical protein
MFLRSSGHLAFTSSELLTTFMVVLCELQFLVLFATSLLLSKLLALHRSNTLKCVQCVIVLAKAMDLVPPMCIPGNDEPGRNLKKLPNGIEWQ